jgi:hypothetical protein
VTDHLYAHIQLPADTIAQMADKAFILMTTTREDGRDVLVPQLVIDSGDLGWYSYHLPIDVLASLVDQFRWIDKLLSDREGTEKVIETLTGGEPA